MAPAIGPGAAQCGWGQNGQVTPAIPALEMPPSVLPMGATFLPPTPAHHGQSRACGVQPGAGSGDRRAPGKGGAEDNLWPP